MYGSNDYRKRRELWRDIIEFAVTSLQIPWAVLGYFHSIIDPMEKVGGAAVKPHDIADLFSCVQEAGLIDCKLKGSFLTWSNQQQGADRIAEKLDRVMVNAQWTHQFPFAEVEFLNPGISDHSPSILTILERRPKPFPFLNTWTEDYEFMSVVRNSWNSTVTGNPTYRLVKKLPILKANLIVWSRRKYRNTHMQLIQAKEKMFTLQSELQSNPANQETIRREREAVHQYSNIARVEVGIAREKANVRRLDNAYGNNKYFHSAIKERRQINNMSCIYNRLGVKLVDFNEIEAECINDFEEVFGDASHAGIDTSIISSLHFKNDVSEDMANHMVRDVTRDEIVEALASIGSDRAPGPDGYSSY